MLDKIYEDIEIKTEDAIKYFEELRKDYEEDRRIYEVRYELAKKYNDTEDKNHFKYLAKQAMQEEVMYGMAIAALSGNMKIEVSKKERKIKQC